MFSSTRRCLLKVGAVACVAEAIALSISGFAVAEESGAQQNRYVSPIEQAGDYGATGSRNIGIMVYYGKGNEVTKEQVGKFVVEKIMKRAHLRNLTVSPHYFVLETTGEGIAVGYHIGNVSVDSQEIRDAVTPAVLDQVLDIRVRTSRFIG